MDFEKVSDFIDSFFEQKNGELKFTRKLVNKEYSKKIGIVLIVISTMIVNLFGEVLSNLGFGKSPNYVFGLFTIRLQFFLLYIVMYIIVGYIYMRMLLNIRASFKEIEEGQKGTSRFATRKEIESQYRSVPIADKLYKGGGGIPIARGTIKKQINNEIVTEDVMFIDDSPVNNLIIGTTRSGKGETFVVPTIDVYSRAEKKPSMIINDPKGELMAMCKEMLELRGYDVCMLNLLQPINSMSYNPLELIKQAYKKKDYSEAQLLAKTLTHSLYFKPNVKDPFWQNSAMSLVNALILAVCDECIARGEEEKITMYTVANMLSELGGCNIPNENGDGEVNKLDEYFKSLPANSVAKSQYATSSFAGGSARGNIFSVAMSELQTYTLEETGKLTSKNTLDFEDIGFFTTIKSKVTVKDKLSDYDLNNRSKSVSIDNKTTYKNEVIGIRDISIQRIDSGNIGTYRLETYLNDDEDYYRKIENKNKRKTIIEEEKERLKRLLLDNIKAFNIDGKDVTSAITVDISDVNFGVCGEYEVEYKIPLNRPKAIFMVTPDYDKSNHVLASIFVRQIYYVLAKKSSLNDTSKCDREVIFLLDEFGNMPPIEGFANIVTVCLGRGIRFNMIIQAYSQLKTLYGEDSATIEGNCGNQIYIMTNENDTAEKFSKLLGEKTIITNSRSGEVFSLNKSQTESLDSRRLLKADELTKLKEGEIVVVRVIKRTDKNGNKIISYPILNDGDYRMKYRYEYLDKTFDNRENVFKNVKVTSLHKDITLDDLILDFSKTKEQVQEELKKKHEELLKKFKKLEIQNVNRIDDNFEIQVNKNILKKEIYDKKTNESISEETSKVDIEENISEEKNYEIEEEQKENRELNNYFEVSNITSAQKNKFFMAYKNAFSEIEKNHIKNLNTKEEVIEYLEEINKSNLINAVNKFFK